MLIEEIFSHLLSHMIKGLMIHDQLASAFGFLNLRGYSKCHEYHYFEESCSYRELQNYYLNRYHKLIGEEKIDNPTIIPSTWFKYMKEDVDTNTKRSAIKDLMKKWIEWEKETQTLLQQSYKELFNNGEVGAAIIIGELITDNGEELASAQEKQINFEMTNYDLVAIIDEQEHYYSLYTTKIKKLFEDDEK